MERDYIINGVYILSAINIIMFFVLLFRKIKGKARSERNKEKISLYKDLIKKFVLGQDKEVPNINNKRDMLMFTPIILEEIDKSSRHERDRLWELSRKVGLIKTEIDYLNKGNRARKAIAAYRLGELGAVESIDDLLANIKKDNRDLSYIIFRSLVLLGGTEYLDRIIGFFDEDDFTIKARMLDLISTIDEEDIYPKMKEYLQGENTLKKVLALESLTNRRDMRVVPYIKGAINSDNKEIKIAGLKAIIGTSSLDCKKVFPMIKHLTDDPEWQVRAFFTNALRICKDCKESVDILKKMTQDSHYQVRFNASERLFEFGELGLVALSEILYSEDKFAAEKAWSLIDREMTLYNLMDKIKDYNSYEYIVDNIEAYKKSIKGGVLVVAE